MFVQHALYCLSHLPRWVCFDNWKGVPRVSGGPEPAIECWVPNRCRHKQEDESESIIATTIQRFAESFAYQSFESLHYLPHPHSDLFTWNKLTHRRLTLRSQLSKSSSHHILALMLHILPKGNILFSFEFIQH